MPETEARQLSTLSTREWIKPSEALDTNFDLPAVDDEIAASVADADVAIPQLKRRFRIGKLHLLITAEVRCELSQDLKTYRIPNTPNWLPGVTNFRGNILPVFNLHSVLNQQKDNQSENNVLIIGEGEDAAGIIVDGIPTQKLYNEHDRVAQLPRLEEPLSHSVTGGYRQDTDLLLEIDTTRLLSTIVERDGPATRMEASE